MKKVISFVLAALMLLSVFAAAEGIQPATRTSTITIEGVEEEITETQYISDAGYSVWYQPELYKLDTPDGQAHFFAIDSTPEGEEPGLLTSGAYLLIVPADIAYEDAEAFLMEATGGFDPETAMVSDIVTETFEDGTEIKNICVLEGDIAYSYCIYTDGETILCITAVCPLEAIEGWGARLDHILHTIEF